MSVSSILDQLADDDRWRSSVIRDLLVHAREEHVISLAGGLPADELLPTERCQVAVQHVLERTGPFGLQYGLSAGEPALREHLIREAAPDPDRILITAGSQQGLDLLGRVLRTDGNDVVVMEDPGYLGAIQVLRSHRYELVGVPVDADGLDVDRLADLVTEGLRPRFCYVNPTFQNPTGATLSPERAVRLVALAEEYDFLIIADDPYVQLVLDGENPTPLPESPAVIRLGSTSKIVSPGLRIGWVDADPRVIERLVLAKQAADLHTSTLNQLLVVEMLGDDAWWRGHVTGLRERYRFRRSVLVDAVDRHLPDARATPQHGGFFLWIDVGQSVSDLLPRALERGVAFVPGSAFEVERPSPTTIRLSYSSGDPARFGDAVTRLAGALHDA